MTDRWAIDWQDDALPTTVALGDHAATRYRHFRRFIEGLDGEKLRFDVFGLVLSAEGIRDEMRAYDQQASALLRLAQTGHYVRLLHRLHGVLDAASDECLIDESEGMKEWKVALDQERSDRVARYNALLMSLETDDRDQEDANTPLLRAIETDEQQEEAMTLLKAAIDKYGHDILTPEEVQITNKAFHIVARHANTVVISLPTWLVMPSEFSSTFGLSRWGNDLLTPEHSDKSRFIEEATTWSKLNHPHVAKFLGACHVGDRPFIVHESVRSLSEYLGEGMDRQKVWQRMYEVALALQYLHERGLVCDDLTLESVYCGLFDAKAMLLGVGLARNRNSDLAFPDEDHSSEGDLSRISPASSDIEALRLLILDCLRAIAPPISDDLPTTDTTATGNLGKGSQASLDNVCPAFVEQVEWKVLEAMRIVDVEAPSATLFVIDSLRELAGVAGQQDGFENSLVQDFDSTDEGGVGAVVVQTIGKSIAEILACCDEMADAESLEKHVQSRLADVFKQMEAMDWQEGDSASRKEQVAHFAALLLRLYRLLEQKTGVNAVSQISFEPSAPVSMVSFHSDIDRFLELHKLSSSSGEHEWKPKWELLSSRHQFVALSTLIRRPSPHLPLLKEEEEPVPPRFESTGATTLSALRYGRKMLLNLRKRRGGGGAEISRAKLPGWFLPPTEVEFKSFAEFSRGAFGSVHLGKWFNTRVVVKRVFTDMDDRATVQDQFRREADVWFKLNHINVVKMYGACHIDQPFFVCEYASGGNLDSYLEREGRDPRLVWYSLLNAALGLQYLHDNGIVHADLKADNILVGSDGVPKLTDFGLSVSSSEREDGGGGGALGAYRWKAPETLPSKGVPGNPATFASDVYSFAMVMIEIVSGSYPWGGSMPDAAVAFHVKRGRLPARPPGFDDPEWGLIERMCYLDPAERVTIDAVVVHLSSLIERLDMAQLWPTISADDLVVPYKNHVLSRGGALLSLMKLAKSSNERLVELAMDHLLSVSINRVFPADAVEVGELIELMRSGSDPEKVWAVNALRHLAWSSHKNKTLIVCEGGISPMVTLARDGNEVQKDSAVRALRNVSSVSDDKIKQQIASAGSVAVLIAAVRDGSDSQKEHATVALGNLSSSDASRVLIASSDGISAVTALVRDGSDIHKEKAARALWDMAVHVDNKTLIASAGGIPSLVTLLRDGNAAQRRNAVGALFSLSFDDGNKVLIASAGGISVLVALVRDGNDFEKEKAANALWNLSFNDDNEALIVSSGGIAALIQLVRDGNDVQKEKATGALQNLTTNSPGRALLVTADGISTMTAVLRDGTDSQKIKAAYVLGNLATNSDYRSMIGSTDAIPVLVAMVRGNNAGQRGDGAYALWKLSQSSDNQVLIAAAGGIPPLVALVRDGDDMEKENAAVALQALALNAENKVLIASAGGIPNLIALVRDGTDMQKQRAAAALWNLAIHVDNKVLIASAGGIPPLVTLLSDGNDELKKSAAGALSSLAANAENKVMIASAGGIPPLVALLSDGNDEQKQNAAGAVWNLAASDENKVLIASAGGIPPLVTLLRDGNDVQKHKAAGALSNLANNDENGVLITSGGGVPPLVVLLRDGNDIQKKQAAVALSNVALNADNAVLIASAGAIPLLVALAHDGNNEQKTGALAALINLSGPNQNAEVIVSSGGIPLCVALVCGGADGLKDDAACVLWNLAFKNPSVAKQIVLDGGVDALIRLFLDGNEDQKLSAAGALGFLDLDARTRGLVVENGAIAVLLKHIQDIEELNGKEEGLVALGNLCCDGGDPVRARLAEADGGSILTDVVQGSNPELAELASTILSKLTTGGHCG